MSNLLVNIDHIATLRNQRGISYPSILGAAVIIENAGAFGITAHLREDRRHIKDQDIRDLKRIVKGSLNMEMALTDEMENIALGVKPEKVCLVPEKREELTTEGGLNIKSIEKKLIKSLKTFKDNGIEASLFIEPEKETIQLSKNLGAEVIELHTGMYANQEIGTELFKKELNKLKDAISFAKSIGLKVNLGHGLDYDNIIPLLKLEEVKNVSEYNIGFSIISMSIFCGIEEATKKFLALIERKGI